MKLRYAGVMTHADADSSARQPALVAESIGKQFGDTQVLKGIDLNVAPGEIVALLGPSGCGKTTLLRIAAGLLSASTGHMQIAGQTVVDGAVHTLPPEARGIGMVFQDYALWPHLSVLDNVAFPLRMRGERKAARHDRARKALARVGLDHLADRSPGTLSGGQQQRVALARAIVAEPPLVLFDEPLSNLDRELRESLALEMSTLLRELGLSAIYVTHDQAEAFTVADRVAIMIGGEIAQIAAPETIFSDPASVDVAQFLNIGALIDGDIAEKRFRGSSELLSVETPLSNGYEGRQAADPANGSARRQHRAAEGPRAPQPVSGRPLPAASGTGRGWASTGLPRGRPCRAGRRDRACTARRTPARLHRETLTYITGKDATCSAPQRLSPASGLARRWLRPIR
jgi:iron(III) transport system ATP-binding protein